VTREDIYINIYMVRSNACTSARVELIFNPRRYIERKNRNNIILNFLFLLFLFCFSLYMCKFFTHLIRYVCPLNMNSCMAWTNYKSFLSLFWYVHGTIFLTINNFLPQLRKNNKLKRTRHYLWWTNIYMYIYIYIAVLRWTVTRHYFQ
jgi:hypothetical protein